MVRGTENVRRVVLVDNGGVHIAAPILNLHNVTLEVLVDERVVEHLDAALEENRIPVGGRYSFGQDTQVPSDQVGPRHQVPARRDLAGDLAHDIGVAVRELIAVVVAHDDHFRVLQRLDQPGDGLRLLQPFRTDPLAPSRIVEVAQRPVVDGHNREVQVTDRRVEHDRRAVVERVDRAVSRVDEGFAPAVLGHLVHGDTRAHQETDRLAAAARRLHVGGVGHIRVVCSDLGGQISEGRLTVNLLHGDDVGRTEHLAYEPRQLAQLGRIGARAQIQEVLRSDRDLGRLLGPDGPRQGRPGGLKR